MNQRSVPLLGAAMAFSLCAGPLSAQDSNVCWRGHPDCSAFMIVEVQLGFDALDGFGRRLELGLGIMKNVSSDWAVGGLGTVSLSGRTRPGRGLSVRGRHYVRDDRSVELEAGMNWLRLGGRSLLYGGRMNFADYGALFARHEVGRDSDAQRFHSLVLGGGAGSTPAAIAAGAGLLGLLVVLGSCSSCF